MSRLPLWAMGPVRGCRTHDGAGGFLYELLSLRVESPTAEGFNSHHLCLPCGTKFPSTAKEQPEVEKGRYRAGKTSAGTWTVHHGCGILRVSGSKRWERRTLPWWSSG